jgi:hypothetical protein
MQRAGAGVVLLVFQQQQRLEALGLLQHLKEPAGQLAGREY